MRVHRSARLLTPQVPIYEHVHTHSCEVVVVQVAVIHTHEACHLFHCNRTAKRGKYKKLGVWGEKVE